VDSEQWTVNSGQWDMANGLDYGGVAEFRPLLEEVSKLLEAF
jgi:hypothetical protein